MEDFDFEEQIRLERETRLGIVNKDIKQDEKITRVEEDGTVMEFDEEKRAWFPKIDDDFIARYQMSYGMTPMVDDESTQPPPFVCSLGPPPPEPRPSRTYTAEESDAYWQEYNDQCRDRYRTKRIDEKKRQGEVDSDEEDDKQKEDKANDEYDYTAYYVYYHKQRNEELAAHNEKNKIETESTSKVESSTEIKEVKKDEVEELSKTGDDVTDAFWKGYFKDKGEYVKPAEIIKQEATKNANDTTEKKREDDAGWFDSSEQVITSVYIQGLPDDIDEDELRMVMSRCGLIASDPRTRKMKPESVSLAVQIIDGSEIRGSALKVEPAKFKMKGNFDPSKKKKKLANKEKNKHRKHEAKLFDWKLESDEVAVVKLKHERTVIIKNAFDPTVFEGNMLLINQVRDVIRKECSKYGEVKKVLVYDRHADGVASILFKDADEADKCVASMDNRFLGKRLLQVCIWNGTSKYEVQETGEELEKRTQQWNKYLDEDDDTENSKKEVEKMDVTPDDDKNNKEDKEDKDDKDDKENVSPMEVTTLPDEVKKEL